MSGFRTYLFVFSKWQDKATSGMLDKEVRMKVQTNTKAGGSFWNE